MTRTPPPTYAARVEAARTARGLTVTGLAEAAGMTRYNLQKILAGRTSRLTLAAARRLAAALGTTVDDLFPPD